MTVQAKKKTVRHNMSLLVEDMTIKSKISTSNHVHIWKKMAVSFSMRTWGKLILTHAVVSVDQYSRSKSSLSQTTIPSHTAHGHVNTTPLQRTPNHSAPRWNWCATAHKARIVLGHSYKRRPSSINIDALKWYRLERGITFGTVTSLKVQNDRKWHALRSVSKRAVWVSKQCPLK